MKILKTLCLLALGLTTLCVSHPLYAQVTAGFTVNYPTPNCNPVTISFTNTSTGAATYEWYFGQTAGLNSTLPNPSTIYSNCGTFTVMLIAINGGQRDTTTQPVTIFCKPTASLSASPTKGCIPLSVQFINSSTIGSGPIATYFWDFGDGNTGSGSSPKHDYTIAGCKNVTLLVTDVNGCKDDSTYNNLVCVNTKPTAAFTSSVPSSCSAPFTIKFNSTSTGAGTLGYQWRFLGGTPTSSTTPNPTVTYNTPGIYNVQLVVTDSAGCTDTLLMKNYAAIATNIANFTTTAMTGCLPLTVGVSGISSSPPISWAWTAPGGSPSTGNTQDTAFTFNTLGPHQICLTVTYPGGCVASKCTTVVATTFPTANFTVGGGGAVCKPPLNITYTNISLGIGLSYEWQFPGGTPATSTLANPGFISYTKCGVYDATLIVTNVAGCTDTITIANAVNVDCPTATFLAIPPAGCAPLSVQFASTGTTGSPTFWQWNFGDTGNPNAIQSILPNPQHVYALPGCYDVRLITGNSSGCVDTLLMPDYICVGTPPVASFTATPLVTCAWKEIKFTSTSTGIDSTTTYQWDFIDFPPFDLQNTSPDPSYAYPDTGWFTVTLVVCNNGCCDTLSIDSMIHILPPIASIFVEKRCDNLLGVTLHGGSSIGADTYQWTVPGGTATSLTDSVITVTYPTDGSYQATLVVFNTQTGCYDTLSVPIDIKRVVADFNTVDTVACANKAICFNNTSQNAASFVWGVVNSTGKVVWSIAQKAPCRFFAAPGVFDVFLIATDAGGCSDTLTKPAYITINGLSLAFNATPVTGCVPLNVSFTPSVSSATSSLVSLHWNFGDTASGALDTSSLLNPSHIYFNPGVYDVTLTAIDNHGCMDTLLKTQFIKPYSPTAGFTAVDSNVCLGNAACFNNTSTGASLTYQWDFGDGGTSTLPTPCHTYTVVGDYTVKLIVTDSTSCTDTLIRLLYMHVTSPHADFSADSTHSSCPPLPVNFTNLSTGVDSLTTYEWHFGDGSNSNVANPFHIYNSAGYFDVTLIVKNQYGCRDTIVYDSLISISGPSATVTVTPSSGCSPLNVCFYAVSTNASKYSWDFGNGTVMLNANDSICYTYIKPGIFHPALILDDGAGCVYSFPIDSVVVGGPIVLWRPSSYDLCTSGTVQFTDSSTSINPILSWKWTFGDSASGALDTATTQSASHFYDTLGVYTVTLVVISQNGCTGSYVDTVTVTPAPVIFIQADDSTVCENTTVNFNDSAVSVSPITGWQWDFGDPGSGSSNTSTLPTPSHLYQNAGNYTITLIASAANGCSDTATLPIAVTGNPAIVLSPNSAICPGDTTALSATGGTVYAWLPATGLDNPTASNPNAFPASTTTYSVTVTDANGCASNDSLIISVNIPPIIAASAITNDSICAGTSAQLNAAGGNTYIWQPTAGLNNSTFQSPTASIGANATYTVVGTDANGCTGRDSIPITVLAAPPSSAGPDAEICFGKSIQLTGSAGDSIFWRPGLSLDDSLLINPMASPTVTTTYIYGVVDTAYNCVGYDSVIITVHPLPVVDAGLDETICLGYGRQLNATGALSYSWAPATFLDNPTINNPFCKPQASTTYFVTGTDAFGCQDIDTLQVFIRIPLERVVSRDTLVCEGEAVRLNASGGTSYQWIPPAGLDSTGIPSPLATPSVTTTYLLIIEDSICNTTDTLKVIITVSPLPEAYAGPDGEILAGEPFNIDGSATGTYEWTPPDHLSCTTCEDPVATPIDNATYTLTAINDYGCRREDEMEIRVLCNDDVLYIPNAFSPNNNGKNDVFKLRSTGIAKLEYLRVYDRWGELVFESHDVNDGWDGTFKGQLLPPAVYVFYLKAACANGTELRKQGNVTLVR